MVITCVIFQSSKLSACLFSSCLHFCAKHLVFMQTHCGLFHKHLKHLKSKSQDLFSLFSQCAPLFSRAVIKVLSSGFVYHILIKPNGNKLAKGSTLTKSLLLYLAMHSDLFSFFLSFYACWQDRANTGIWFSEAKAAKISKLT